MISKTKLLLHVFSAIALAGCSTATSLIKDVTKLQELNDQLPEHEFNILSLYTSTESNHGLLEGDKRILDDQIASGEIPDRSVGWFRADIEAFPELDLEGTGIVSQLVINTQYDLRRVFNFKVNDDVEQRIKVEESLAEAVRSLTGEFYREIKCEYIQAEDREFFDEVILMTKPDGLE